jgi:hypothetical protein
MHIPAFNGETFPASAGMTGAKSIRNTTTRFIHQFRRRLIKITCEPFSKRLFFI